MALRRSTRRLAIAPVLALWLAGQVSAEGLGERRDPVVLAGDALPWLIGIEPRRIVAFRRSRPDDPVAGQAAGTWVQIPLQVDERDRRSYAAIYGGAEDLPWIRAGSFDDIHGIFYTDPNTMMGPDRDPNFDADDELVFMSKDAGARAHAEMPPIAVAAESAIEVKIRDPEDGSEAWVYLFESAGSLDPAAGVEYVHYQFRLESGDYKATYDLAKGPNPETSRVDTNNYTRGFSDRWIADELLITAGNATGVDILDRHKSLFGPGRCERSEETFSNDVGAFVANRSGPVRAIRSYLGANSGPATQRIHRFYEDQEVIESHLRVHAVEGLLNFFDYSLAARGMLYHSNQNLTGLKIDGMPDSAVLGPLRWELVMGGQGSLVIVHELDASFTTEGLLGYYLDDLTPRDRQCTGDPFALGSSGAWVSGRIPNTDPRSGSQTLSARQTIFYLEPGLSIGDAQRREAWVSNPLEVSIQPLHARQSNGDALGNAWMLGVLALLAAPLAVALLKRRRADS